MRKKSVFIFTIVTQRLCALLAFLSILMLFSCESYRTALEAQYFQQGEAAFEKKDYAKALEFFTKAQEVSFNNVARYRMAEVHLIQDEFDKAKKLIDTLLWRDRKNILVHEMNILWHIKKGERERAAQLYEELEKKNIHMGGRVYSNVGIFYLNGREYEKALEFFRKADESNDKKSAEMAIAYLTALRLYLHQLEAEKTKDIQGESEDVKAPKEGKPSETTTEITTETGAQTENELSPKVPFNSEREASTKPKNEQNIAEVTVQTDETHVAKKRPQGENAGQVDTDETKETEKAETAVGDDEPVVESVPFEMPAYIALEFERVVGILISLYEKNDVSTELMMKAAEELVEDDHFAYAFALYKSVVEKENSQGESEEGTEAIAGNASTQVKAYIALVTMIVKKQYELSDEHVPLTVIEYTKKILQFLFPRDEALISQYKNSLFEFLQMEKVTEVLKVKMREIYEKYSLISPQEEEMEGDEGKKKPRGAEEDVVGEKPIS